MPPRSLVLACLMTALAGCSSDPARTPSGAGPAAPAPQPSIGPTSAPPAASERPATSPSAAAPAAPSPSSSPSPGPSAVATASAPAASAGPKPGAKAERFSGPPVVVACGCGCCGGDEIGHEKQCLFHAKGDDPAKIAADDAKARSSKHCAVVGCSRGRAYWWCD